MQNVFYFDPKEKTIINADCVVNKVENGFNIEVEDFEFFIRDIMINRAERSNTLIKFDSEKTKLRRVSRDSVSKEVTQTNTNTAFDPSKLNISTTKLKDINFDPRLFIPIKTGTYIDNFISFKGGFLPGINIMLTGDPGVGKSSNLMDILVNIKENDPGRRVLYISAEMSEIDVKEFEQWYPGLADIDFLYIGNYISDPDLKIRPYQALMAVLHQGWDMVVVDSLAELQGMIQDDLGLTSKKCEKWVLDLLRTHNSGHNERNIYSTFLCIQQKNKGGQYVGSKRLEHMTSAFLQLCWDKKEPGMRYMIFEKNRKGKEKVKLYYGFAEEGGIAYNSDRHEKELAILQRLQNPTNFNLDEMDDDGFAKLFEGVEEEA